MREIENLERRLQRQTILTENALSDDREKHALQLSTSLQQFKLDYLTVHVHNNDYFETHITNFGLKEFTMKEFDRLEKRIN